MASPASTPGEQHVYQVSKASSSASATTCLSCPLKRCLWATTSLNPRQIIHIIKVIGLLGTQPSIAFVYFSLYHKSHFWMTRGGGHTVSWLNSSVTFLVSKAPLNRTVKNGCFWVDPPFRFRVQKANFAFLFSGGLKKRRIHP